MGRETSQSFSSSFSRTGGEFLHPAVSTALPGLGSKPKPRTQKAESRAWAKGHKQSYDMSQKRGTDSMLEGTLDFLPSAAEHPDHHGAVRAEETQPELGQEDSKSSPLPAWHHHYFPKCPVPGRQVAGALGELVQIWLYSATTTVSIMNLRTLLPHPVSTTAACSVVSASCNPRSAKQAPLIC